MFIGFIPILGGIFLLIMTANKGTLGDNNYGSYPLKFKNPNLKNNLSEIQSIISEDKDSSENWIDRVNQNEADRAEKVAKAIAVLNSEEYILRQRKKKKRELMSEVEELNNQIHQSKSDKKWINWLDNFKGKIDDLRNSSLSIEEKKKFLEGLVEKISVKTKDKQNHQLIIKFTSPFVNDKFEWNEVGNPKKGYKVIEGISNYDYTLEQIDGPQKGTKKK